MVNKGDRVRLNGRELTVTSTWAQGKHKAFALDDGTTILDLHLLITQGKAELLPTRNISTKPLRFERLPRQNEDHEE